jgi:hypothetical protein
MNHIYLDRAFQTDNRAVMLYGIKDYESPMFIEVGTIVEVEDIMIDPNFRSGYSAVIRLKNSDRIATVDKDLLMPYSDYAKFYNKALEMALQKGRL